ncbi:MAG: glycosyltransferase family 39 protein [Candidatus Krumholzibacteriota bacterium]|nr:glycosyltransferase family 39 protein [Candidatus Krumholzibacteriota bacterium]
MKRFRTIRLPEGWEYLLILFMAAVAIRLVLAGTTSLSPVGDKGGAEHFIDSLARTGSLSTTNGPIHVYLLAIVYRLFGAENRTAVVAMQGLVGASIVILVWFIGTRLFDRRTGFVAGAIAAVYPDYIIFQHSILPHLLLLAAATALTAAATGRRRKDATVPLALISGLGMLVAPVFAFFLPGAFLSARRKRLFVVVLCVILLPLAVRNSAVRRRPVPVYTTWAYGLDVGSSGRMGDGWGYVHRCYGNLDMLFGKAWHAGELKTISDEMRTSTYVASYAWTAMMLLGIAGLARYHSRRHLDATLPLLLGTTLLVLFTRFEVPLRLPLSALLIVYAARALTGIHARAAACVSAARLRTKTEVIDR